MFLSAPNSIPQFLLILVCTIVVMAFIGTLIGTAKDKTDDYIDKKRKEKIEVFSNKEIKTLDDYLRYSFGSPGETARVLTKNYYSLFFDNKIKTKENLLALLQYRNNALISQGIELNEKLLENLADKYSNNISTALFAIVLYENSNKNNEYITESNYAQIHQVVLEEYNKIAPRDRPEYGTYTSFGFLSTKWLFEKYGIKLY